MKHLSAFFIFALLTYPTAAQKKEANASLADTVSWMTNFTYNHGYLLEAGTMMQTVRLLAVEGCTVQVEHQYLQSKTAEQIKKQTERLELGDFDPEKVKILTRNSQTTESFEVEFERSDSADKIVADMEMGDGTKKKGHSANEWIFMDSQESASRLATALTHAIKLCGGKPAPF
jgi:hypothetical protein